MSALGGKVHGKKLAPNEQLLHSVRSDVGGAREKRTMLVPSLRSTWHLQTGLPSQDKVSSRNFSYPCSLKEKQGGDSAGGLCGCARRQPETPIAISPEGPFECSLGIERITIIVARQGNEYTCSGLTLPWQRLCKVALYCFPDIGMEMQSHKKFPAFYGTRRFNTVHTRAHHWSLSWARSIHSISLHPIRDPL
jgi:hypothetical protein